MYSRCELTTYVVETRLKKPTASTPANSTSQTRLAGRRGRHQPDDGADDGRAEQAEHVEAQRRAPRRVPLEDDLLTGM